MSALISIIIPVYKVEEFLDECVSSVAGQTYKDLEIILVDDGSPDRCGKICDLWSSRDERIRVIHQDNGGLSAARNAGLHIAVGDYIAFVDSDDCISPHMIKTMFDTLTAGNADIAECDYCTDLSLLSQEENANRITGVYSAEEALSLLLEGSTFKYPVWNKLYKKSIFDELIFEKGKLHEDVYFTFQAFGKCGKIVKVQDTLYYYRQRAGSIMGSNFSIRNLDSLEARQNQYGFIRKNYPGLSAIALRQLLFSCLYFGQYFVKITDTAKKKKALGMIRSVFTENYDKTVVSGFSTKQKFWLTIAGINFAACCRLRNILGIGK